jgi:hypothetical protein
MDAMPELGVDDARDLLLTCLTLADGWPVLTNADRVITGEVRSQSRQGARRAFFVRAMRAIAEDLRTGSARPPV